MGLWAGVNIPPSDWQTSHRADERTYPQTGFKLQEEQQVGKQEGIQAVIITGEEVTIKIT